MVKTNNLTLLLPFVLFGITAVYFLNIMPAQSPIGSPIFKEYFLIAALFMSVPLVYRQKWASDRNVVRGLRSLFALVVFTYLLLLYSNERIAKVLWNFEKSPTDAGLGNNVFLLSWAFFMAIFVLIMLGTLKNLIFIKQKKSTAFIFSSLMILMVISPITEFFLNGLISSDANYLTQQFLKGISKGLLFIIINLMVINAFRLSWINYLNRQQKMWCFWGGLILAPMQVHFAFMFYNHNPIEPFSIVLSKFLELGVIFAAIYVSTSVLSLLSHLPTAKLYDRKIQQIDTLHNLSRMISSEFELEKLVIDIVKLASDVCEADSCWLELVNPQTKSLELLSSHNLNVIEKKSRKPSIDDPLAKWLQTRQEAYLHNQMEKSRTAANIRKWKKNVNSLLAVPLVTGERVIGIIYAVKRVQFGFELEDAAMLRAFCDQAVIALENTRLVDEFKVKEALEQELKIAHEAQMKLLPKEMPVIKGLQVDGVCITANEVGGDYYDFFDLGNNKLGVVIGDVSGKGPSAAFYMAEVKGVMDALSRLYDSPKKLLVTANDIIYKNFDRNTFISVIYGILDVDKKQFAFCRAGHNPVLKANIEEKKTSSLQPKGIGVGMISGEIFEKTLEEHTLELQDGDALLLFTDGVVEARNSSGDEYGDERLISVFDNLKRKKVEEIKKELIHDIYTFTEGQNAFDDLTFVVLKLG